MDFFQILVLAAPLPYLWTFFKLLKKNWGGGNFLRIFFIFVNMGSYWSKNFKTLLLQITAESFQTSPEFSSQWSSQDYVWDFESLKIEILMNFFLCFRPNGSENFKMLLLQQIAAEIKFSNLSWIFLAIVLTKFINVWDFETLSLRFLTIFFQKFQIHHSTLWRNQKCQL